ncbi:hypothetical protein OS493_032591 [Desmophyllum pertusum]|uniref:Mitochondria-eating protein C-terminal domain-containing protein n=1 Tax=Desmophyllum pertusum TaxID=174260 RepID=A0A9W9YJ59_9CNID|nr:hypothetical protein OS493_032591 [Desmophyllum pertusum]
MDSRWLEEFLGKLTNVHQTNEHSPRAAQIFFKKLIEEGEDMVEKQKDQDRQKREEQQFPEDGQPHNESMEDKDEERKISMPQVPLEEDVEGNQSSVKKIKDDVNVVDTEDEYETRNSSYVRSLEEQLTQCKRDLETKRSFEVELRQCQRELETKESEIEELKKRSSEEELRQCKIDLETKKREIESLKKRRTRQDQRDVEATLSLNRQSKVEQDFKDFASDERIDACIEIQNIYKGKMDINARRLTCMMFETVYEYVLTTKGSMTDAFKEISKFVIENGPGIGHHCFQRLKTREEPVVKITIPLRSSGSEYSRDVLDGLLLSVKESAPKVNTDIFMKGIKLEILRLAQERKGKRSCRIIPSMELLNHLDDYLKACIQLTWRMVTQVPPLKLEYQTFGFHRDYHKLHAEACADGLSGQEVCYLWPGLVVGGGRKIILGEVILQR